jgi:hypothetical protein
VSGHVQRAERQAAFFKQFPRDTGWVESEEEGQARMDAAMPNPSARVDSEELGPSSDASLENLYGSER